MDSLERLKQFKLNRENLKSEDIELEKKQCLEFNLDELKKDIVSNIENFSNRLCYTRKIDCFGNNRNHYVSFEKVSISNFGVNIGCAFCEDGFRVNIHPSLSNLCTTKKSIEDFLKEGFGA